MSTYLNTLKQFVPYSPDITCDEHITEKRYNEPPHRIGHGYNIRGDAAHVVETIDHG